MLVFFSIMFIVALILFVHPYVIYPASLYLFPARRVAIDPTRRQPSASLLFCAYNEERSLPSKVENLRAISAGRSDVECLAYSDCSSDGTLDLLQQQADLIRPVSGTKRTGKALGMRRLVTMAQNDILVFTDANVILDPRSIDPLLSYFSDPEVGGVAGTLVYVNPDESTTAQVSSAYWRLEEVIKQLESRCGSIMGADGSIFAVRRELYPEVPGHLLDDFIASISVTFQNHRLIHATDVVAYERSATVSADEFRRKRRIACRAFNTHRYLWPTIRRRYSAGDLYKYVSHKLLRWFGMVTLSVAAVSAILMFALVGLPLVGAGLVVAGAGVFWLGQRGVPVASAASELLLSIAATYLGIIDSLRGKTYQTWAPALSRT